MTLPTHPSTPPQSFTLETLACLPLAEAFYTLWAHLANQETLNELFDQHRGRCYHDLLSFAELVQLLSDALTRYQGSGRRAIVLAAHRGRRCFRLRCVC